MIFFSQLKSEGFRENRKNRKKLKKMKKNGLKNRFFLPCTLSDFNILYTKMYLLFELFSMVMVIISRLFEIEREKGR